MIKIKANTAVAALFLLCIVLVAVDSASAHRVNVFAWVEGDTVHVESKFAGGKRVKAGKIIVMDPQGNELLRGITDDQGEFSFKVPTRADLKIVLVAGQGHQGEWTIRSAEMAESPAKTASETSAQKTVQAEQRKTVPKTSFDSKPARPENVISPEELEAIIETVLDRKLKPITRMMADIRQDNPSVGEIVAGIGYIFGLVGIVAYVHSRKKKE